MPNVRTQMVLDPTASAALAGLETLHEREGELQTYDGALAREWQPLPSESRARNPQAAALSDGWGQRVEAAMAEQRSLVEARSALFKEREQVSAALSLRYALYAAAVLAAVVVLGVLASLSVRAIRDPKSPEGTGVVTITGAVTPALTPTRSAVRSATPTEGATATLRIAATSTRTVTRTATRTHTARPASPTPPVVVVPYYRDAEGDAVPELVDLAKGNLMTEPGTVTFDLTITSDTPVRLMRGWCAADRPTLEQNLPAVSRGLVIDGYTYDLETLGLYDYDINGLRSCQGREGVVRRWPLGRHVVTSLLDVSRPINDGWQDYRVGRYVMIYNVNVVPALPTATPLPRPKGPDPSFRADNTQLQAGECTTLRWDVEGIRAAYLGDAGVGGHGSQVACPPSNTTYELRLKLRDGSNAIWPLEVRVSGVAAPIDFYVEELGCIGHQLRVGQVKGQLFDRIGGIIVGAQVEVVVEGNPNAVPPSTTNPAGWYESQITAGQDVTIKALKVGNRYVSLTPRDVTVRAQSGCYQLVNLRQH